MARRHADDMVFYATLGIILGGRLGYVLFYRPLWYIAESARDPAALGRRHVVPRRRDRRHARHPVDGLRKHKLDWLRIHDYVACCVPFGLFLGRLANFVNRELWGRATDVAWAIQFPECRPVSRRPWRSAAGRRPAAPSEPALRGRARGHPPVPRPLVSLLEDPRPLPAGQAGRHLHPRSTASAASSSNSSASRTASWSSSPRSPIFTWASGCPCR